MISGRDIVYITGIEWDFLWQTPQEVAARLAQAGNRVLYIENIGIRSPGIRDAGRVVSRLKRWTRSSRSQGVRQVASNLYVCSPLVLPPFGPRWQGQINRRFLLPLVRRAAHNLNMRDILLWTYLPADTAVDLIRLLRSQRIVVVYYCMHDFAQLTPAVYQVRRSEKQLVHLNDLVFVSCAYLYTYCA